MSSGAERFLSEIDRVQNPALGAALIWAYGRSYQSSVTAEPSPLLLGFVVLPLCFHRPTLNKISSTWQSSGLGKFCEKLGEHREELFAVHERCIELRRVTFSALSFGEQHGLLRIDYGTAQFQALDVKKPRYPERVVKHAKGAEKLGAWFSELGVPEIFHALRIEA